MQGIKMGKRFAVYLFREAKLLLILHNAALTLTCILYHILENLIYSLISVLVKKRPPGRSVITHLEVTGWLLARIWQAEGQTSPSIILVSFKTLVLLPTKCPCDQKQGGTTVYLLQEIMEKYLI